MNIVRSRSRCWHVIFLIFLAPLLAFGQGSLTPPGAPGPTMKTLDQMEPRLPVDTQHTPGDANAIYVISQPGSYYLTTNVIGIAGVSGIRIDADDVTLDLNGFAMIGNAGTQRAINLAVGHQNISIFNGTVQGWGSYGVYLTLATNCHVSRVCFSQNYFAALKVGYNSTVSDCIVANNSGYGIFVVGSGNRIANNDINSNTNSGLFCLSPGNLIVKNNANFNGGGDYNIAPGNSYGQIVVAAGANFTNATAWANFSSSCASGQTLCGGVCVLLSSDANNCGACGNVCALANSSAACVSGSCAISSCSPGYLNCDNISTNGCEVNIMTSVNNCGSCGHVCSLSNATAACTTGTCAIASCSAGWANCDNLASTGCEINVNSDPSNCGGCGHVCPAGHLCLGGACN